MREYTITQYCLIKIFYNITNNGVITSSENYDASHTFVAVHEDKKCAHCVLRKQMIYLWKPLRTDVSLS